MDEQEIFDALMKGPVVHVSEEFTWSVVEMDDLPPGVRACFTASRKSDHEHMNNCPDCLDSEVECLLMDAASHREDGNAEVAESLETEAKELRRQIAMMRARM